MNGSGKTIAQVAEALDISIRQVRRYLKDGRLEGRLVKGRFGMEYRVDHIPALLSMRARGKAASDTLGLALVKDLQRENMRLAHDLGLAEGRVLALESQVRLLTGARRPWWKRLARRG